ncbi:Ig-like domain-containing protein, partial [Cloacibacillus sp.]
GTITNNAHRGGVSASGGSDSNAGGIAGYNSGSTITNNAHSGGTVTASGGSDNYAGGIAGYNDLGNISNSCWPAGDLEAVGSGDKGPDAVSADVVSLDAAEMKKVVTTILPAKRTLSVEVGGFAPALTSYPGRADDMAGYLSVSGDIFIASPDIAGISNRWPCTVSGIKPGVTAVSFDIDLRATDFSDKNNLKPLTRSCATGPLCFTAAVGKVPVSGVSLDFTELTLDIGASKTLTAAVKPDNATDKAVVWTSADPAVAAVDESGKVTALSVGTTVVTAKAGEKSAACTVTVARKKTGGSGHGCAAGLGALPMLALVPLWLRRKKR